LNVIKEVSQEKQKGILASLQREFVGYPIA